MWRDIDDEKKRRQSAAHESEIIARHNEQMRERKKTTIACYREAGKDQSWETETLGISNEEDI
jgi:hypothetical protein